MAKKLYQYEVQGNGDFPWDMLRYDRAWPMTDPSPSLDTRFVVRPRWESPMWTEKRTVQIEGHDCTADRWASFGWHVRWTTMKGPWTGGA